MPPPSRRSLAGFTLVELLITLAVIGVLAAIAIPNLMGALQRGKQKRSMGDIRSAGTACELYSVDNDIPVQQAASGDLASVSAWFEPTYIKVTPDRDGWGGPMQYVGVDRDYTILSRGRDRSPGGGGAVSPSGTTTDFDNDIIFGNGSFVQYPEGTQKL
jgi:general secretion pathway protein G